MFQTGGDIIYLSRRRFRHGGGGPTAIPMSFASFDPATALSVTMTNSNLTLTAQQSGNAAQGSMTSLTSSQKATGKWYFEFKPIVYPSGGSIGCGICTTSSTIAAFSNNGTTGIAIIGASTGQVWSNGGISGNIGTVVLGTWAGIAIDLDNRMAWFRPSPSGNWNASGTANPTTNVGGYTIPTGTMVPIGLFTGASMGAGSALTANFGSSTFAGAVPSNFIPGWAV